MIEQKVRHAELWGVFAPGCLAMLAIGCQARNESPQAPAPATRSISLAVVPAINLSGSFDFDPISLGDLMASELTQLGGVRVVGVNRVLAMMAELGLTELQSPEEVSELADRLGTDGILVFAITEYDPYDPPVVGMSAQVFLTERGVGPDPFHEGTRVDGRGHQLTEPASIIYRLVHGGPTLRSPEERWRPHLPRPEGASC